MLLTLFRSYKPNRTLGRLLINGERYCYTAERGQMDPKHPCIPEGEYPLILAFSPKYQRIMPRLLNVPGREGILIHTGNDPVKDSEGCILVGYDANDTGVGRSRVCFNELFAWLQEANKGQVIAMEIKEDR